MMTSSGTGYERVALRVQGPVEVPKVEADAEGCCTDLVACLPHIGEADYLNTNLYSNSNVLRLTATYSEVPQI